MKLIRVHQDEITKDFVEFVELNFGEGYDHSKPKIRKADAYCKKRGWIFKSDKSMFGGYYVDPVTEDYFELR